MKKLSDARALQLMRGSAVGVRALAEAHGALMEASFGPPKTEGAQSCAQ